MSEYLKRLKELRTKKGNTQKEIADYLGITAAAYSLYERGSREPNMTMLNKIAKYYNVSPSYLLGFDSPEVIAAHFDGDEYTEEELEEIRQFAEFVKNRRNAKKPSEQPDK